MRVLKGHVHCSGLKVSFLVSVDYWSCGDCGEGDGEVWSMTGHVPPEFCAQSHLTHSPQPLNAYKCEEMIRRSDNLISIMTDLIKFSGIRNSDQNIV